MPTPQCSQVESVDWNAFVDFESISSPPSFQLPSNPSIPQTPIPEAEPEADNTSSTASWDSRNRPRPEILTPHPPRQSTKTTRNDRIRIQIALFDLPHALIREKLDVTERQICSKNPSELQRQRETWWAEKWGAKQYRNSGNKVAK
ncbi:hypothetical protein G7Y89_g14304 [Cudoniella acicularis]|uniref:Uncharacterized protein n=1 Tax=Cudoniella acicularis TaxID=354080 RepID=A0A8H4VWQ4_9HELO|nr:hypothetical protein G7Y89_g14304 [Cudoniella acicularis]